MNFNTNGFTPQEMYFTKGKIKGFDARITDNTEAIEDNAEAIQDIIDVNTYYEDLSIPGSVAMNVEFISEGVLHNENTVSITEAPIRFQHFSVPTLTNGFTDEDNYIYFKLIHISGCPLIGIYVAPSTGLQDIVFYTYNGSGDPGSITTTLASNFTAFSKITYIKQITIEQSSGDNDMEDYNDPIIDPNDDLEIDTSEDVNDFPDEQDLIQ